MSSIIEEESAPAIWALAKNLIPLVGFLFALAMASQMYLVSRVIAYVADKTVGRIPVIGGILASPLNDAAKWVNNEAAKVVGYLEGNVAHYFYGVATEARWIAHEIAQIARISLAITTYVAALPGRAERYAIARAVDLVRQAERAAVRDIRKEVGVIAAGAGSIAAGVLPKLGRLEHDVNVEIPRAIEDLRGAVKRVEDGAIRTWEWVRAHPYSVGATAFAGAVAWALSRLGLAGLRCNALRGALNKRGCGLWRGLEDVLGLLFDAVVLMNLCEIIPKAEGLFAEVEGPLVGLISRSANAICARPPKGWDTLSVGTLHLPTSAEIIPHL